MKKMPEALLLSHWDAAVPIMIPHTIVEHLTNYNILGIRFLYNCFQKGQRGAILNEEQEMNPYIQISALLNALNGSLSVESSTIIICTTQTLNIWNYYLSNYTGHVVVILTEQSSKQISQENLLILSTVENLKWLKGAEIDFFTIVLDDIDLLINRRFVKSVKGQFHIGITIRNFLKHPDQKLFRNILIWCNPNSVGKLEQFCQQDTDHLDNNRFAYNDYWFRLTWSFCDSFQRPTEDELDNKREVINNWANQNNPHHTHSLEANKKRVTRKRKHVSVNTKEESNSELGTKLNDSKENLVVYDPLVNKIETSETQNVSSQETIIYDYTNDDNCLLTQIVNDHAVGVKMEVSSEHYEEPKIEKCASSEDILLSIMNDDFKHDECNELTNHNFSSTKNDVLSMLFSDSE